MLFWLEFTVLQICSVDIIEEKIEMRNRGRKGESEKYTRWRKGGRERERERGAQVNQCVMKQTSGGRVLQTVATGIGIEKERPVNV